MRIGTIDASHLRGFAEKFFGLQKEVLGTMVGNERLREEGEAQQTRGTEALKALRDQLEAEGHEAKARTLEQKQRAAQRIKEAS
jgi:uncharacterized protein YjbJ (UPF0337 family)